MSFNLDDVNVGGQLKVGSGVVTVGVVEVPPPPPPPHPTKTRTKAA